MATISDVARGSGVSRTAVSFAFNDPSRLSAETLKRILDVAEDLGYFPSPVARSLTSKRVGAIGLLIPQRTATLFANPFFAELLRGIGHICDQHEYALLLVPPFQGSLTRALSRAAVDGFIVIGIDEQHPAVVMLHRRHIPFVTIDAPALPRISSVNVNDREGARLAAAHILGLGHRDVLVIRMLPALHEHTDGADAAPTGPFAGVAAERLAGYRDAFDEAGVPFPDARVVPADSTREGGYRAMHDAWAAGARPTAVLAMSDIIALGVMDAARECGLALPDQLSIAAFDDILVAALCRPALTTVHQPAMEKGIRAARLLIDRHGGSEAVEHHVLPAALVVRDSTAPLTAGHGPRVSADPSTLVAMAP